MLNKKDEILEMVTPLFIQNGFRGLTVNDIANQLNVSKKTIYKYFNSKEKLIAETKDFVELTFYKIYDSVAAEAKDSAELLHNFIVVVENDFGFNQLRTNFMEVKYYYAEVEDDLIDAFRKTAAGLITMLIKRATEEGLADEHLNKEATAITLGHMYVYISTIMNDVTRIDYSDVFDEFIYIVAKVCFNEEGLRRFGEKRKYIN